MPLLHCPRTSTASDRLDVFLIMRSGFFTTLLSGVHAGFMVPPSLLRSLPTARPSNALSHTALVGGWGPLSASQQRSDRPEQGHVEILEEEEEV